MGQEQSSPTVSAESQVTITPELIEQKHVELMTRLTALKGGKIVDQIDLIEELKDKWNSDLLLAVFLKYQTDEAAASVPGGVCHKDSQLLHAFLQNMNVLDSRVLFADMLAKCSQGRFSLSPSTKLSLSLTSNGTHDNGDSILRFALPGPEVIASEQAWIEFLSCIEKLDSFSSVSDLSTSSPSSALPAASDGSQSSSVPATSSSSASTSTSEFGVRLLRCLGSQYASMLADCFGHETEFNPWNKNRPIFRDVPEEPIGQFQLKRGQFTDDSSMGLCLMDNLIATLDSKSEKLSELRTTSAASSSSASSSALESSDADASSHFGFDAIDCELRFQCWNQFGYNCAFGFDPNRRQAFFGHPGSVGLGGNINQSMQQFWRDGRAFTTAGDKNTCGNGSVMRLAPLHFAFHADIATGMRVAAEQSLVTHQGTEAADCCRLLAFICNKMVTRPKDSVAKLRQMIDSACDEFARLHCEPNTSVWYLARSEMQNNDVNRNWNWRDAAFDYSPQRAANQPGYVGSYVMDAMSMALHIAYHHTASLPSAILWNSSKGGDADSVGAVLGQIIGSYFDIRWIPFEWVKMIFRWDGEPCGTVLRRSIKLFQLANIVQK